MGDRFEKNLRTVIKRCEKVRDAASRVGRNKHGAFQGVWNDKVTHVRKLFGSVYENCDERDAKPNKDKRSKDDIMLDQNTMHLLKEAGELLTQMAAEQQKARRKPVRVLDVAPRPTPRAPSLLRTPLH